MTAEQILRLNGNLHDSEMMNVVRRFHAFATARGLPYCVVGGMAVVRNGYPRTTEDVDILTYKAAWQQAAGGAGDIVPDGPENCVDKKTGVTIDILFSDDDWQMPMAMPDARSVGEYDESLGAVFIGLHALVQLKASVYLSKLWEEGENVAHKDGSDVFELIKRNIGKFSKEAIEGFHPAVREHCMTAYKDALKAIKREKRRGRKG